MEFHSKLTQPLPDGRARGWNGPLPFYMSYPGCLRPGQEALVLGDLEYLQQLYPNDVKRYRRRVAEILDTTDYEGSMIYDEYPDRCSLQRLTKAVSWKRKRKIRRGKTWYRSFCLTRYISAGTAGIGQEYSSRLGRKLSALSEA